MGQFNYNLSGLQEANTEKGHEVTERQARNSSYLFSAVCFRQLLVYGMTYLMKSTFNS